MQPRSTYIMDLFEVAEAGEPSAQQLSDLGQKWSRLTRADRQGVMQGLETWARKTIEAHIRKSLFDAVGDVPLSAYGRAYLIKISALLAMSDRHPGSDAVRDALDELDGRLTQADRDVIGPAISAVNAEPSA